MVVLIFDNLIRIRDRDIFYGALNRTLIITHCEYSLKYSSYFTVEVAFAQSSSAKSNKWWIFPVTFRR